MDFVYRETSSFGDLRVYESAEFGKLMILNQDLIFTEALKSKLKLIIIRKIRLGPIRERLQGRKLGLKLSRFRRRRFGNCLPVAEQLRSKKCLSC